MIVQGYEESYDTMRVRTTSPCRVQLIVQGFVRGSLHANCTSRQAVRPFIPSFTNRCTPCPQCSASICDREELARVPRVAEHCHRMRIS